MPDIYFYLQANIKHISIVSAGSTFPEEFSHCSDANCAVPCGGKLFHCTLCCRSEKRAIKQGKLKKHFRNQHWNDQLTQGGKFHNYRDVAVST